MKRLDQVIEERTRQLPQIYTKQMIQQKLADAGAPDPDGGAEQMTAHIFGKTGKQFRWPKGSANKGIKINLAAEDFAIVREQVQRFLDEGLPEAMRKAAVKTAKKIVKEIYKRWESQCEGILEREEHHRLGIVVRWGPAIDGLRILRMSSLELGDAFLRRERRRRSLKNRTRNGVIIRLHARACQVTGEIIALLEAGYADGAFARWRTLHEISVVAFLIDEHGDDLAERYLAHEAVEHEKAALAFESVRAALGARPILRKERAEIRSAYDSAIAKYGLEFEKQYGWAAVLRGGKRCTFGNLEELAGRNGLRLHYKYASDVVHAGQRAIRYPISTNGDLAQILAGPSNLGLEEAGVQTAYTLTALSTLLISPRASMKQLVELGTFELLRNKTARAFIQAASDLAVDMNEEWSEP